MDDGHNISEYGTVYLVSRLCLVCSWEDQDLVRTEQCAQIARGAARSSGKRIGASILITFTDVVYIVYRCKKCKGNKTVKEKTRQEIYIERGMADRQRIVLAGAGDEEVCQHTL